MQTCHEESHRNHLILFVFGLLGFAFKFLFNLFLTRHLSSATYGDFSVALSIFNIVSAYMLFGTAMSSFRFFSNYLKTNRHDFASTYMAWNLRVVFISSIVFLFLLAIFTTIMVSLHVFHIHNIREYHLVVYFLWIAPLGALTLLFTNYLLCDKKPFLGAFFASTGVYFFGFVLLILAIYIFNIVLRTEHLWLLILASIIIITTLQLILLFFRMREILLTSVLRIFKRHQENKMHEQEWLGVSLRLILNQIVYMIVTALDLILLEIIDPNENVVGFYAAALTVAGLIWVTQQSLFQFVTPMVSTLIHTEKEKLQRLIDRTEIANIILNGILITLIIVFIDPILKFFGPAYIAAKIPLLILLAASFVGVLSAPGAKLLAFSGNEKALFHVVMLQIVVMLFLAIILIYLFSAIGAAIAVFITLSVRAVGLIYMVRTKLGMKTMIVL